MNRSSCSMSYWVVSNGVASTYSNSALLSGLRPWERNTLASCISSGSGSCVEVVSHPLDAWKKGADHWAIPFLPGWNTWWNTACDLTLLCTLFGRRLSEWLIPILKRTQVGTHPIQPRSRSDKHIELKKTIFESASYIAFLVPVPWNVNVESASVRVSAMMCDASSTGVAVQQFLLGHFSDGRGVEQTNSLQQIAAQWAIIQWFYYSLASHSLDSHNKQPSNSC